MIKKIEETGDLDHITVGTILIKYPISGEFAEDVDFNDHANLINYEVHSMNKEMQVFELKIPDKDIPSSGALMGTYRITEINEHPPVLNKTFEDLITDKIWWYEE